MHLFAELVARTSGTLPGSGGWQFDIGSKYVAMKPCSARHAPSLQKVNRQTRPQSDTKMHPFMQDLDTVARISTPLGQKIEIPS